MQGDLLALADALSTATSAFELQQGGDKLVRRLKEMQEQRNKSIQSKIDMLKQESLEALGKASPYIHFIITDNFIVHLHVSAYCRKKLRRNKLQG